MSAVEHFDLLNSPLEGTNLIEASAGTGKTYTITGLFLRLVLERRLSAEKILVVTFTEAATEELKERIRTKLREAYDTFTGGVHADTFLGRLAEQHPEPAAATRSLLETLRDFDQAAIYTIHGFCRRVLQDHAFESGSPFDTELMTNQEEIKQQVVDDFWRRHVTTGSPLFVQYILNRRLHPDSWLDLISKGVGRPHWRIIPEGEIPDASREESAFMSAFEAVRDGWPRARSQVKEILATHEGLHRGKYATASIPHWIGGLDRFLKTDGRDPDLFAGFEKLTTHSLEAATKKGHAAPHHPFFDLCEDLARRQEDLLRIFEQRLLCLQVALFQYAEEALARTKEQKNVQSFDDLLLGVLRALEGPEGRGLETAVRRRFHAALIDEFQDTDPIQYAIFRRLFGSENSTLFLIGDPKQAIYSFRGADVFAYMEAARDVDSRYTLRENWRSDPDLITAVNALFARHDRPFVFHEIPFRSTRPALGTERDSLRVEEVAEDPLQIWFLDAAKISEPGKSIPKSRARALIPPAVAAEIARLLLLSQEGRATLGARRLMAQDLAVLVRTNAEAGLIQEALQEVGVPSVLYSTGNLFDSREAIQMERLLSAVANLQDEGRIRTALTTDLFGIKGPTLDALSRDEARWEQWMLKFRGYHDLWMARGFIYMFQVLLNQEEILPRLTALRDGERRATNLLHLAEVIHQVSTERRLGMAGLLKWLSERRDPKTRRLEEHQLRLESDENAVHIVTIHRSKGLEYPVVFCPFSWGGSRLRGGKEAFLFHDPAHGMKPTLDLGSEGWARHRRSAENETLAENVRLLYVALTRAKNRCYLVWGRFREGETSAPAYLLHTPQMEGQAAIVQATETALKGLDDAEMQAALRELESQASGKIRVSDMPAVSGKAVPRPSVDTPSLESRTFRGRIETDWKIASFSSLTSARPHAGERGDRDELPPDAPDPELADEGTAEPSGIFAFPKGARAGTFLHDLLEHLDFTVEETEPVRGLVGEKLRVYGFDSQWEETLTASILKLLSAPLEPDSDLHLAAIPNEQRLNELEFCFPLNRISADPLKQAFGPLALSEGLGDLPERIGRLQFAPTRGFMRGFIDLVFERFGRFYLVDWKSNHLGNRIEDYHRAALCRSMAENLYVLQYHIYTLALDRYLSLRRPGYRYDRHFGGVFYIFLRGVNPGLGPEFGIFRDLPSPAVMAELRQTLLDRKK